jgi:DNA-binding CsgD family transcriptional regulator
VADGLRLFTLTYTPVAILWLSQHLSGEQMEIFRILSEGARSSLRATLLGIDSAQLSTQPLS